MQSTLIFSLVALGVLAKLGVLWRCFSCRLATRIPLFCCMVFLSLVRSALALNGKLHPYQDFWTATQWPMAILEGGAALEAFWRVATHFHKMRNFNLIFLGLIVSVATGVSVAVGLVRVHWNGPLRGALLFGQYTQLGLLVVALLAVAFFWQFRDVPVRPNATLHLAAFLRSFSDRISLEIFWDR